jgi:P27 family predicted phage terminase small subunit
VSNLPKPTALKRLQGTDRADRANPNEPTPPLVEVGTLPPVWIRDRHARAYWRELVPILTAARMLALTDTTALAILAKAYGRWRHYEDFIERNGETYDSKASLAVPAEGEKKPAGPTMLRPRPEVAMRDKAEDRLVYLLAKFGMTPSDRTHVSALPQLVGDPSEEFLRGRPRSA